MKMRTVLSWVAFSAAAGWTVPAPAAPPVKVEVVIDGEDEADDFFEDDAPRKKSKRDAVRENAEEAFEDLEAEEAARGKRRVSERRADNDNDNKNTQVVNVVVVGGEQQGAKATAEAKAPPEAPAAPVPPGPPGPPPPPPGAVASSEAPEEWSSWGWFGKDSEPKQADLLLFGSGGGYTAGAFFGLGAEAYATDVIGIRLVGHIGEFSAGDIGGDREGNLNLFDGGHWANQRPISRNNVEHGVAHLVDLSMTFHVLPRSSFDPYLGVGFSHFGYDIEYLDGVQQGGAGYGRLGVGFNWHIKSFFAGLDVGWYPYEFFRYRIERTLTLDGDGDGDGFRGRHRRYDYEAVSEDIEDHFDPERFTATAHIGWRF